MNDTIIIAELCQNHNGDFEDVRKMVHETKSAGATHVKIQSIYADMLNFRPQFEDGVEIDGETLAIKRPFRTEYERLKALELNEKECSEFIKICVAADVIPLTTCFSHGSVIPIRDLGFREVKVASYDCASHAMIERLCKNFKKLHISTGATFDDELGITADIIKNYNMDVNYFHCVTMYPTPLSEMHLARMEKIKNVTGSSTVGLSDHSLYATDGLLASKAALALGASSIERHYRLRASEESRDGPVSIDAAGLAELVDFAKKGEEDQISELNENYPAWMDIMYGNSERNLTKAELLNRDYYRGRFGTKRNNAAMSNSTMIMNWERYND